jgi:hypothetical protein
MNQSDPASELANTIARAQGSMLERLCAAFLSEVGCLPSEAEIVTETVGSQTRIWVRKRNTNEEHPFHD